MGKRLHNFGPTALESPLFGAAEPDKVFIGLARLLCDIVACTGQVSDQLDLRYFARVDDVSQKMVPT